MDTIETEVVSVLEVVAALVADVNVIVKMVHKAQGRVLKHLTLALIYIHGVWVLNVLPILTLSTFFYYIILNVIIIYIISMSLALVN